MGHRAGAVRCGAVQRSTPDRPARPPPPFARLPPGGAARILLSPERFSWARADNRPRCDAAQPLLRLAAALLASWRRRRRLAGGRARFPGRRGGRPVAAGCRHGERAREPLLQPDDDERCGACQCLRHQGLGHPLQDGAAGAPERAGPRRRAARPAGAAAAQPATAAAAAGRGRAPRGREGDPRGPLVLWPVATYRSPPQGPDMPLSRLLKAIEESCSHLASSVHIRWAPGPRPALGKPLNRVPAIGEGRRGEAREEERRGEETG